MVWKTTDGFHVPQQSYPHFVTSPLKIFVHLIFVVVGHRQNIFNNESFQSTVIHIFSIQKALSFYSVSFFFQSHVDSFAHGANLKLQQVNARAQAKVARACSQVCWGLWKAVCWVCQGLVTPLVVCRERLWKAVWWVCRGLVTPLVVCRERLWKAVWWVVVHFDVHGQKRMGLYNWQYTDLCFHVSSLPCYCILFGMPSLHLLTF